MPCSNWQSSEHSKTAFDAIASHLLCSKRWFYFYFHENMLVICKHFSLCEKIVKACTRLVQFHILILLIIIIGYIACVYVRALISRDGFATSNISAMRSREEHCPNIQTYDAALAWILSRSRSEMQTFAGHMLLVFCRYIISVTPCDDHRHLTIARGRHVIGCAPTKLFGARAARCSV